MALDKSILVDIPEHGIAYKKVSGKTYVYYVTATYRNKKGQPTCDRSSIGRLDEETGKLNIFYRRKIESIFKFSI